VPAASILAPFDAYTIPGASPEALEESRVAAVVIDLAASVRNSDVTVFVARQVPTGLLASLVMVRVGKRVGTGICGRVLTNINLVGSSVSLGIGISMVLFR